jgi:hypothetical protein
MFTPVLIRSYFSREPLAMISTFEKNERVPIPLNEFFLKID